MNTIINIALAVWMLVIAWQFFLMAAKGLHLYRRTRAGIDLFFVCVALGSFFISILLGIIGIGQYIN